MGRRRRHVARWEEREAPPAVALAAGVGRSAVAGTAADETKTFNVPLIEYGPRHPLPGSCLFYCARAQGGPCFPIHRAFAYPRTHE